MTSQTPRKRGRKPDRYTTKDGKKVGFDWRSYYPTTLQKKFSWIEEQPEEEE